MPMLRLVMAQRAVAEHLVVYTVLALDTMIKNAYIIHLDMPQASRDMAHKAFRLQRCEVWY